MTRPVKASAVHFLVGLILYVVVLGGVLTIVGDETVSKYLSNVTIVTAALALGIGGVRVYGVNGRRDHD